MDGIDIPEYTNMLLLNDIVPPTVASITYPDSNTIKVSFSEPINTTSLGVAGATTIKLDGVTKVIPSTAFTLASDKKSYTIDIPTSGLESDKNYSIAVSGLTDYAANALTDYSGNITFAEDTTNPTVESVTAIDTSHIKVQFSEKIKANSPKFVVKFNNSTVSVSSINDYDTVTPDGKTFVATLAAPRTDGETSVVTVAQYQDVAGNPSNKLLSTYSTTLTFNASVPTLTSNTASVSKIGSDYYAILNFDRPVKINSGTATITGTYVDSDGVTNSVSPAFTTNSSSRTIFGNAQLSSLATNQIAIKMTGQASGTYTLNFTSNAVTDLYGNGVLATTNGPITINYNAATAQKTVTGVWLNKLSSGVESTSLASTANESTSIDEVLVQFSAPVGNDALDVSHYTVDGVQVFSKAIFDGSKTLVRLTLKDGSITTSTGTQVAKNLEISGIDTVKDVIIYKDAATATTVSPSALYFNSGAEFYENVDPTLSSVKLTALDKIQLTFSEDIAGTPTSTSNYKIKVNGTSVSVVSASESNGVVVLTLTSAIPATNANDVTVELDSTNGLTDVAGNSLQPTGVVAANVDLQDLQGLADAALVDAFSYVDANGALVTGKTATQLRTAVNSAKTALDNAGLTVSSSNWIDSADSITYTYAQAINALEYAAQVAEDQEMMSELDLTDSINYTAVFTTKQAVVDAAKGAAPADLGITNTSTGLNKSVDGAYAKLSAEKTLVDAAVSKYTALTIAIDAAVDDNTGANLATADTAAGDANVANIALTTLSQATKTKLTTDAASEIAKITADVANVKVVKDDATHIAITWGSNDATATDINFTYSIDPSTQNGTTPSVGASDGEVTTVGNSTGVSTFTVSAVNKNLTDATSVSDATFNVADGGTIVTVN